MSSKPRHPLTEAQRGLVVQAWLRCQVKGTIEEELPREETDACALAGVNPGHDILTLPLMSTAEVRRLQADYRRGNIMSPAAALGTGPGAAGGYTVPETLLGRVEVNLLAHGPIRQLAEIYRTEGGGDLTVPTVDDTSNTGERIVESATIGSSVDPAFGAQVFGAHKYSSKVIKFPAELLQEVPILVSLLADLLGERLGRITNTEFTTGDGAAKPRGIVTAATTVAAASATAISFDDVAKLEHALDPAYRDGAAFMCADDVLEVLRGLKDGNGRHLFVDRIEPGAPYMLRGRPLHINQAMDSTIASGKKTLLFGQFWKYKIRSVGELRLHHLVERYRDTDTEAVIAYIRETGDLLNAGTVPVKVLAH